MDPADLAFAGVARQADLVRRGEVSSRELVELYLGRIERIDRELNSYRTVRAEEALEEADQADRRRSRGEEAPLLGVPLAIKDNVDLEGEVTTNGLAVHDGPAARDSEVVRRLRDAGAVFLGKTNVPELCAIGATESATWGVTRNPWDLERTPGGSSGGSGAAVAAGLAAASQASDGAGSIRIPAACCGLFGLKPQRGRVSLMPQASHWSGMSVHGALTRTVEDSALLLDAMAGPAPGDEHVAPPPRRSFGEAAGERPPRLRVAVSLKPTLPVRVDAEVRQGVEDTADLLRSLGHDVRRQDPAYNEIGTVFIPRYVKGIQYDGEAVPRPERLQRRTRGFVRVGRAMPRAMFERALRDEARQAARINRIFDDHDVVVTPVTARLPARATEWEGMGGMRTLMGMAMTYPFTAHWNATGQPAASVPAGLTADGIPLAVQLIGRPNDEGTLLSLAAQLEAERGWPGLRPPE